MNSYFVIYEHAVKTLPDSLAGRKKILKAIDHTLPDNNPLKPFVGAQLATLTALDQLQQESLRCITAP